MNDQIKSSENNTQNITKETNEYKAILDTRYRGICHRVSKAKI